MLLDYLNSRDLICVRKKMQITRGREGFNLSFIVHVYIQRPGEQESCEV